MYITIMCNISFKFCRLTTDKFNIISWYAACSLICFEGDVY